MDNNTIKEITPLLWAVKILSWIIYCRDLLMPVFILKLLLHIYAD